MGHDLWGYPIPQILPQAFSDTSREWNNFCRYTEKWPDPLSKLKEQEEDKRG